MVLPCCCKLGCSFSSFEYAMTAMVQKRSCDVVVAVCWSSRREGWICEGATGRARCWCCMVLSCCARELIVEMIIRRYYLNMTMNNRLHKLTDSLESELNYYSRVPGKPTKNKTVRGSPLLREPPSPNFLITSRCLSPNTTPHHPSRNSSLHNSTYSQNSPQILIVDSPQAQKILIMESQDKDESEYQHQNIQESHNYEKSNYITPDKPLLSSSEKKKQSPIYILEEDQNLIWIQKQEEEEGEGGDLRDLHDFIISRSDHRQGSIKIEEEEEEGEDSRDVQDFIISRSEDRQGSIKIEEEEDEEQEENSLQIQDWKAEIYPDLQPTLPEIKQLFMIEQQQVQESFHVLTTSRIPVSPHTTQPVIKFQKVQNRLIQLQHEYWIGKDPYLPSPCKQNQEQSQIKEQEGIESRLQISESIFTHFKWFNESQLKSALAQTSICPMDTSKLKSDRLRQNILPRRLNSIQQMRTLIDKQACSLRERLNLQLGTINIYQTLLTFKIKLPYYMGPPQSFIFNHEQQILINQYLIRCLVGIVERIK